MSPNDVTSPLACQDNLGQRTLGHNLVDDPTVDVSQPEVATSIAMRQSFVVQPHQVQNRRVQVVQVDATFDGTVTKIVRGAVLESAFDATTGQPHRIAIGIVVATIQRWLGCIRSTTKFSAP